MSKIAYVGNFEPEYSTENDVRKAFEFLGHEVIKCQENSPNIFNMLETFDYDLLLITGTWDPNPQTLVHYLDIFKDCADRDIPTATLHLDTFWGKSRGGRKWWLHPMFSTAYIFTADGDYQDKWKLLGKNHIWLPPAVRYDAVHKGTPRPEYECDVAFVGSNGIGYHEDVWTYRRELVDALREMCQRNGWSFKNPGGDQPKIDRDGDMNDFYASAKITVGDSLCLKKENSHYWSDRVPEATGRGGFLIMPEIYALDESWPYLPCYTWGDFGHLEAVIRAFIDDKDSRDNIVNSCMRSTQTNETYVNRAETILREVGLA